MKQVTSTLLHRIDSLLGQIVQGYRSVLVLGIELVLIVAANLSAFALRFDANIPVSYDRIMWRYLPGIVLVFGSSLWVFGIQRGLWRYVGLHDLGRIFLAALVGAAAFYGLCHLALRWAEYPRSIIILTGLLTGLYPCRYSCNGAMVQGMDTDY